MDRVAKANLNEGGLIIPGKGEQLRRLFSVVFDDEPDEHKLEEARNIMKSSASEMGFWHATPYELTKFRDREDGKIKWRLEACFMT